MDVLALVLEVVGFDCEVISTVLELEVAVLEMSTLGTLGVAEMVAQEVTVLDHEAALFEVLVLEVTEVAVLEVAVLDEIGSFEVAALDVLEMVAPEMDALAVLDVVVLEVAPPQIVVFAM